MAEDNQEPQTNSPHPLAAFVRTSEATEAEKASWAEFDAILKDNRVGSALRDAANEHHAVHFPYHGSGDPWAAGWGVFADDPVFDQWTNAIKEYRREREAQDAAAFDPADTSAKTNKQAEVVGQIG